MGGSHEKLKRDFGAAAAEKRLNSNLNNFFFWATVDRGREHREDSRLSAFFESASHHHPHTHTAKLKDDISQQIGHVLPIREVSPTKVTKVPWLPLAKVLRELLSINEGKVLLIMWQCRIDGLRGKKHLIQLLIIMKIC